jgi:hypothetical protein
MDGRFSPLSTTERYSIAKDEWAGYDGLPTGEGGVAARLLTNGTENVLVVAGGSRTFSHPV